MNDDDCDDKKTIEKFISLMIKIKSRGTSRDDKLEKMENLINEIFRTFNG